MFSGGKHSGSIYKYFMFKLTYRVEIPYLRTFSSRKFSQTNIFVDENFQDNFHKLVLLGCFVVLLYLKYYDRDLKWQYTSSNWLFYFLNFHDEMFRVQMTKIFATKILALKIVVDKVTQLRSCSIHGYCGDHKICLFNFVF